MVVSRDRLGRPHAVEQRKAAVAVAEEAQHRHHAVDGVEQRRRRRNVAGRERGAQRQQVDQDLDQRTGIAADVAAVGQDLALELVAEPLGGAADVTLLARHAERRVGQRDRGLKARHAVARLRRRVAQVADLAGEAAQEAAIEPHRPNSSSTSGAWLSQEMMRRATTSGRQATGSRELQRDPLVDQRARIGAGDARFGGAQVPQPAEAEQRGRPFLGRRRHLERRAGVADHHLAGEHEPPGVDLGRARGVGGAQILRRNEQAVGLAERERPLHQRMGEHAPHEPTKQAARQEHGQFRSFRDRNARHQALAPSTRALPGSPAAGT